MKKSEICREIETYFTMLPEGRIRQVRGSYTECGGCVFAHVCHYFKAESGQLYDYQIGANLLAKALGFGEVYLDIGEVTNEYGLIRANIDETCLLTELLQQHGASYDPFSFIKWPTHPKIVFGNIAKHHEEIGE